MRMEPLNLDRKGLVRLLALPDFSPIYRKADQARAAHKGDTVQIRAIVERGGLIGINYYTHFLRQEGLPQPEDLYRHVSHFLYLGAEHCLALGSDFDGADLPSWLQSPKQAAGLYDELIHHGFSASFCDQLMWGNALAFFQKNLPAS